MSKSKPQSFESVRREIARRLKAGLPLAGMIAATGLLCGCSEGSMFGRTAGDVPMDRTQRPAPSEKNGGKKIDNNLPAGDVKPPPNKKSENIDPAGTMGRYPAKKEDK